MESTPPSTPTPSPQPIIPPGSAPSKIDTYFKIGIYFIALLAIIFVITAGCHINVLNLLGFGPSKVVAGPGAVNINPGSVDYTPPASKTDPDPKTTQVPKAPDDQVVVKPLPGGGSEIDIERLAFISEPTIGGLWNGSFSGDAFEVALGVRLVKYSRLGLGPIITIKRVGAQLDYRIGNLTGAAGMAFPFGNPGAPGLVVSINVIPFN